MRHGNIILGGLAAGLLAALAGCSTAEVAVGDVGEAQFRERTIPVPDDLDEKRSVVCAFSTTEAVEEVFRDTYLPGAVSSGDVPCFLPSDSSGGGAIFDFTGDGRPDIIWTNPQLGAPVFLENRGDWRFVDVSAILIRGEDWRRVNGVAVGDVDNDGDGDMFFTRQGAGGALLLVNHGRGDFVNESAARGVSMDEGTAHFGESAVFGDYDGDGWLDLHTTENRPMELSPREALGRIRLFRNLGGEGRPGVFEDVTLAAGVSARLANGALLTFVSAFHDFDTDGLLDLYLVSDFNTSRLFLNNGDGTFRDGSRELPLTTEESGMGISIGDVSGDGVPDVFLSAASQSPGPQGDTRLCADLDPVEARLGGDGNSGNRLFVSAEGGTYTDLTDRYGVRHGGWGWGTIMQDFANTGRLGIVQVANRSVVTNATAFYCLYDGTAQPVIRYWEQHESGALRERSSDAGLRDLRAPKSPLSGDLDGDGDTDLVVFESANVPRVFENTTRGAGERGITLTFKGERHRANARVTVTFNDGSRPLVRVLGIQNGIYSASYGNEIIGLGDRADNIESLHIEYADGTKHSADSVEAGEKVKLP